MWKFWKKEVRHTEGVVLDHVLDRLLSRLGHLPQPMKFTPEELTALNEAVRERFKREPMLVEIDPPLTIMGDVHGQFYDVLRWFDFCGEPPSTRYLFLGDYVDRGQLGLETLCLLFCLKVKYPDSFWMLRGNHESGSVNVVYGFFDEMRKRYGPKLGVALWQDFCHTYNWMPISAVVAGRILCMHGGISPDLHSLDQIRDLPRPTDVPDYGLMCDLVWSDPQPGNNGWWENIRKMSFLFGTDVLKETLERLGIEMVIRGHQVLVTGYQFGAARRILTVFSAPNCNMNWNDGASVSVDENLVCSLNIIRSDETLPLAYLPEGKRANMQKMPM